MAPKRRIWLPDDDDQQRAWELTAGSGAPFDPRDLGGVVTAWLRVANSTVTGAGISSLPDVLNTNPAVQGTDANRPALGASANGLPLITGATGKVLFWPLAASNNGTSQWGIAMHMRSPLSAAARAFYGVRGANGADVDRIFCRIGTDESVNASIFIDASNQRQGATAASQIGDNTWHHVTIEFDGTAVAESAKLTITIDAAVKALTFSNPQGAGALPATLTAATGNGLIISLNTGGSSGPFLGDIGPNILVFGSKMAGATEGLLTAAARTALSGFERPS